MSEWKRKRKRKKERKRERERERVCVCVCVWGRDKREEKKLNSAFHSRPPCCWDSAVPSKGHRLQRRRWHVRWGPGRACWPTLRLFAQGELKTLCLFFVSLLFVGLCRVTSFFVCVCVPFSIHRSKAPKASPPNSPRIFIANFSSTRMQIPLWPRRCVSQHASQKKYYLLFYFVLVYLFVFIILIRFPTPSTRNLTLCNKLHSIPSLLKRWTTS